MTEAGIVMRLRILRKALADAKARTERIDERIGILMTQRADWEERQAEIMAAIERHEK